jgi:hypothetical protein
MARTPSPITLEAAPQRAFDILMTIAAVPRIRCALEAAGLDAAERDAAWDLLRALLPPVAVDIPERDEAVLAARAFVEEKGPSFLRRVEHAARRVDAHLADSLFAGLSGPAARTVPALLGRLDATASPALRARLRRLRLDEAEAGLRAAVARGRGFGAAPVPEVPPHDRAALLLALHHWVREWSETARAVLPRRLDHIRLGIARMRRSSAAA